MSKLRPFTVVFRDGREMLVATLADAAAALDRLGWTDDDSPMLLEAARQVAEAMDGRLTPQVGYRAFIEAARRQGMLKEIVQSAAWADFEGHVAENGAGDSRQVAP